MACRATASLAVRSFLRLAVDVGAARSFDDCAHAALDRSGDAPGRLYVGATTPRRGRPADRGTIAIDATTLEANAAMRSIVRRDTGRRATEGVSGGSRDGTRGSRRPRASASGFDVDRKPRKKKTSNTDWTNPHDPDAKVTKMKDWPHASGAQSRACLSDMETGAIVAVTLHGADVGDTTTIIETAIAASRFRSKTRRPTLTILQSLDEMASVIRGITAIRPLIDLAAGGISVLRVRAGQGAT